MAESNKEAPVAAAPQPTPGAVVAPGTKPVAVPPPATSPAPAAPAAAAPATAPQSPAPEATTTASDPAPFAAEIPTQEENPETADQSLTWNASEFHAHEKSVDWYVLLAMATIIVGGALYFLTKSVVTPVVVAIGGIMLGIFGTHRPKQIDYGLDSRGIRIGTKQYAYEEFRLFIVAPQSIYPEVTLIPTKRFMPSLSLRYTPEVKDKALSMLADHLPFEERRLDLVDNLMQRIHF